MRTKGILIFALLLFFAAACGTLSAATLEGTVLDPSGQAVPGARITLQRSLVAVEETRADARGAYRFEGLPEGQYRLSAAARGLTSSPEDLDVRGADPIRRDIHLQITALVSQVVVSASLGGALVPEIGSSVSLVDRHEISARGAQNAFEVVREIPGVEVSQAGRRGGVTGVYIRGGESKYNAIMMDGIPLNEFGGSFDMASLPADGIERVEVTRGPESALYGPNALTGVINIVSRRGEGPPRFTALAEGGSYATRRFATGGSGLTKGFSWSYNFSRLDSDGVVDNDSYRNQTAFLSLGYKQGNRRGFDVHFFGNANDAGAPGPYGSDPNGLFFGLDTISRGKQNLFGYQVAYAEQFSSRIRQITTVSLATNDTSYRTQWGDSDNRNLRGIFNTRSEIAISGTDTLAAGFEFNREQIRHTYISDSQFNPFLLPRTSFGYFAENRWSPSNRLYLITGIRLDNLRTASLPPDAWGSRPPIPAASIVKVNPRFSIAYIAQQGDVLGSVGGTRLHGSFGTGIRPPDGFELAFTNNPGLKPERSVSFDAGVEQRLFASRAVVDFTYFYNRFQDQIVTLGGSMINLSSYRSANLKNSKAQGLEATFRIQPLQSLEIGGQYSLIDSEVLALDGASQANAPFRVGQPLIRRPRHSGSYNLTWRHRNLTINTNAYIRGKALDIDPTFGLSACSMGLPCFFDNKGYTRADLGVSYRMPHGVELYGRLNNFLNQKYEEVFGYPALRLNFLAGIKFSIPAE
jgi:outer membrane receptor protein involved in Fe transport